MKEKFRKLTENELEQCRKGIAYLTAENETCKIVIEGLQFDLDNMSKIMAMSIIETWDKIKKANEEILKVADDKVLDQVTKDTKKEYYDYLIKKYNWEIEKGIRIKFEVEVDQVKATIQEQQKKINTNDLVIADLNEKLKTGLLKIKK